MKKIFLSAFLLGTFGLMNAQNTEGNNGDRVKFGVKTSVNYFTNTGDVSEDLDYNLAPQAGAYVNIPFGKYFAVQPELNYTRVGSKESSYAPENEVGTYFAKHTNQTVLDYISLPVMLKFYPAKGFNIEVGPQLAYNIYAKNIESDFQSTVLGPVKNEIKTDIQDDINELDFGVNFGLGYELQDTGLNFGARYYMGISNIVKESENADVKNSGFTLGVGYSF
jgi:hypothetical protein